ncbi:MAG: glycosyltransferase family 1 protein [Patescibacteria group bacterium]
MSNKSTRFNDKAMNEQASLMKIALVSGASSKLDSVRGIGANNQGLFDALRKASNKKVDLEGLTRNSDFSKFDIVHFTAFRPFFISLPFTKPKNTKFILTVHDLIPLIYPKYYQAGIKGRIKFLINKILIKLYVDAIITISETSKKDICRFLGVKSEIVNVIYIAPKKAIQKLKTGNWEKEIKEKYKLPNKFVLFDHGINYNKNLTTLLKACNITNTKVVVIGKEATEVEGYKSDLKNLKGPQDWLRFILGIPHPQLAHLNELSKLIGNKNIIRVGYVSDEDLNKLFNLATVCIQPSFYEGFGMPPLEAMTVGCPVICSKTQALVEVCEDACLYFDPYGVDDLVEKINKFMISAETRNEYIKKGFEQVKKYSWDKNAKETIEIYAKA